MSKQTDMSRLAKTFGAVFVCGQNNKQPAQRVLRKTGCLA
jgi:hypothetical protein